MVELTEKQFKLLENFVKSGSIVVLLPSRKTFGPEPSNDEKYAEALDTLKALAEAGFMEDKTAEVRDKVNESFQSGELNEDIEQLKEFGVTIPENYQFESNVFTLTENAIRMFAPPAGGVN